MSNRNSKKFSLLVYCLIIGGLFFTNIHNNVLGIESRNISQEESVAEANIGGFFVANINNNVLGIESRNISPEESVAEANRIEDNLDVLEDEAQICEMKNIAMPLDKIREFPDLLDTHYIDIGNNYFIRIETDFDKWNYIDKDEVRSTIMHNISVPYDVRQFEFRLYKLYKNNGWQVSKAINHEYFQLNGPLYKFYKSNGWDMPEKHKYQYLADNNNAMILLPCFVQHDRIMKNDKIQVICDLKSLHDNPNNYPKNTTITLSFLTHQHTGQAFYFTNYPINKHMVHSHNITTLLESKAVSIDNDWIYLNKVCTKDRWITQLMCENKNDDKKQIINVENQDVKEELEDIWNKSTSIYSNDIQYVSPYEIKDRRKEEIIQLFTKNFDAKVLCGEKLKAYVENKINNKDWFISLNGEMGLIDQEYNILLFPTINNLANNYNICDPHSIKLREVIIFQSIYNNCFSIFNFYKIINDSHDKDLINIKEGILKPQRQLIPNIIYLIEKSKDRNSGLKKYLYIYTNQLLLLAEIEIDHQELEALLKAAKSSIFDVNEKLGIHKTIQAQIPQLYREEEEKKNHD
jgi:hypothetical protein